MLKSGNLIRCNYCSFEPAMVNINKIQFKGKSKNWKDMTAAQRKSIVLGYGELEE